MLTLFRNEVKGQASQDLFGYDTKRMDVGRVKRTTTSIARLDVWVESGVHCLEEKEANGRHGQEEHVDTNIRMVKTTKKQLLGNVR